MATARGTGTNGYVQANLSNLLLSKKRVEYNSEADIRRAEAEINRGPNEEILQHQRKRIIEMKCAEFEMLMEEKGFDDDEIQKKVSDYRKLLLGQLESGELNLDAELGNRDSHARAKAAVKGRDRMRDALGLSKDFVPGKSMENMKKTDVVGAALAAPVASAGDSLLSTLKKEMKEKSEKDKKRKKRRHESSSSSSSDSSSSDSSEESSDSDDSSSSDSDESSSSGSVKRKRSRKVDVEKKKSSEKKRDHEVKSSRDRRNEDKTRRKGEDESGSSRRDKEDREIRHRKEESRHDTSRRNRARTPLRRSPSDDSRRRKARDANDKERRRKSRSRSPRRRSSSPRRRSRSPRDRESRTRNRDRSDEKLPVRQIKEEPRSSDEEEQPKNSADKQSQRSPDPNKYSSKHCRMAFSDEQELIDQIRHELRMEDDTGTCARVVPPERRRAKYGGLPLDFRMTTSSDEEDMDFGDHYDFYEVPLVEDPVHTREIIEERLRSRTGESGDALGFQTSS
ncbi:cwf21 domain-containing protein [Trichostrongylus colubriformis]|uniref:Cwf21 domain-containing protein n=1 Tax=Trichostrongylus colubriformis TaxID=6319 RepID=A0AAN8FGW8_TRICO